MSKEFTCVLCEQTERRCTCTRYCWLCCGYDDVRLCEDGQYYCGACRESCEMQAQYQTNV